MRLAESAVFKTDAFKGMPVVDVDTHFQEPWDLWTKRAPKKFAEQVPQVRDIDGVPHWFIGDAVHGRALVSSTVLKDGTITQGWGFLDTPRDAIHPGAFETKPRLELMDDIGIWAQIMYPNLLGFGNQTGAALPKDVRLAATQIYNDAMAEMQEESGGRLLPMALVPWWDIDMALKEIERTHKMGMKGLNTCSDPQDIGMADLKSDYWNPMWELAQDLNMPINFHIGASQTQGMWFGQGPWPSYDGDIKLAIGSAMMFFGNARVLANLMLSGICERYPRLKFVSVESGAGWIPFLLEGLDYQVDQLPARATKHLSMKPSDYFRRQMYACYWFERKSLRETIDYLGPDNLMFETDFPHPTCLVKKDLDKAAEVLAALPADERRKITGGTAAKVYNLTLPT